jgi:hypothetical protein
MIIIKREEAEMWMKTGMKRWVWEMEVGGRDEIQAKAGNWREGISIYWMIVLVCFSLPSECEL